MARAARRGLARTRRGALRALRPLRRALARARSDPACPGPLHLAWTGDPRTTLSVVWQAAAAGRTRVELRDAAGTRSVAASAIAATGPAGLVHRADLGDLRPDAEVSYRVVPTGRGASREDPAWHAARTAPAGRDAPFRAAFLCDLGVAGRPDGTTAALPALLEELVADDPLFVLGGGDYAYADRDARFRDPAEAIDPWFAQMQPLLSRAPLLAQYGNHEVALGERYEDWAPHLPHPPGSPSGRSYSFDVGAAHFAGLFAPGQAPPEEELRWLAQDLAGNAAREAAWRIVFQHAPLFAHGSHHPARPEVQRLAERFETWGVDLHLSGHDQSFERTHPLRERRAAAPLAPAAEDAADALPVRYAAGSGVVYAKVSPTGKRSDRGGGFSRLPDVPAPGIAARDDAHHHWALLDVSVEELEVRTLGLAGPGASRRTLDRFALVRRA